MMIKDMEATAEKVTGLMKVLSNRNRLMILCLLVEAEQSVGALAGMIGAREQAVSQQLALLRKDGLVAARRDGQTIYYSLARPDIRALMEFLHAAYCPPEPDA